MSDVYECRSTLTAGNALFARSLISSGSIIASFTSYLTAGVALANTRVQRHLSSLDFSQLPALNEKLILTLFLALNAQEKDESLPVSIRQLPGKIQNGVWRLEQDEEMQYTPLWPAILAKRRILERQWSALAPSVCSFDSWKWADSIVSSRCIGLSEAPLPLSSTHVLGNQYSSAQRDAMFDLPQHPDLCLVPILDLCNHAGGHRNARWDVTDCGIALLATRDIAGGDEITISYGDEKSNDELWFNYGFTVQDNAHWQITLTMPNREEAYWTSVKEIYGLSQSLRFTDACLDGEASVSDLKIMQAWRDRAIGVTLNEREMGTLLLSSSADLLEHEMMVKLFSNDHDLTEHQVAEWAAEAIRSLQRALDAAIISSEMRLKAIKKGSLAQQLIREENRGLSAIRSALDHS